MQDNNSSLSSIGGDLVQSWDAIVFTVFHALNLEVKLGHHGMTDSAVFAFAYWQIE